MANKYFRQYLIPDAGVATEIYATPDANTAIIRSLRVTNPTSTPTLVTVTQFAYGVATGNVLQGSRPLGANSTFDVFNGIPCVLESQDTLEVTSSEAGVHFYLSYLEVDRT